MIAQGSLPAESTCRLCLRTGVDLRRSHIVPRWVYHRIRGTGTGRNPVIIRGGRAIELSDHAKEYLLCQDCEQLFGRIEKQIERASAVEQQASILATASLSTRAERHPTSDQVLNLPHDFARALRRFALGVFWRMHEAKHKNLPRIELGRYSEDIRAFLAGEARAWPRCAELLIGLVDIGPVGSSPLRESAAFAASRRCDGYHAHECFIAGWKFQLLVGGQIPRGNRIFGAKSGFANLAFVVREHELGILRRADSFARAAKPVGRLKRTLDAYKARLQAGFDDPSTGSFADSTT